MRRRGTDGGRDACGGAAPTAAVTEGDARGDDGDLGIGGVLGQRPAGNADVSVVGARAAPVLGSAWTPPRRPAFWRATRARTALAGVASPLLASRCKRALCEAYRVDSGGWGVERRRR
jgi:hypothetical protein